MVFSVRVEERGTSYHTEIEAVSAEDALRKLNKARNDTPARFVFLRHQPSKTAGAPQSTRPRTKQAA